MPLHVRLDSLPAPKTNLLVSILTSTLSFFLAMFGITFLWVLGAVAESKLSGTEGLSSGMAAQSSSVGDKGSSNEPKQYNQAELPESSKKTFADVKGCVPSPSQWVPVLPFKPKYCLGHPENYLFFLSKNMFIGSKYPKNKLFNFEKTSLMGTSASFLAELSVSSPQKLFIFII